MIRVCLVDDQALVRQGLVSLLKLTPDIAVVAEAADGGAAVDIIEACKPDVVVLDVRLPVRWGPDVLVALAERGPVPPTLLLTTFDDDEALIRGILAGARGYLRKDVTLEQFADAIRTLASGGSMIHPAATARIAAGTARRDGGPTVEELTSRQLDVLRLVAAGLSNREIAVLLQLSEGTVKNHVSEVLAKLGVRDRTRAVLKSFELGWL